MVDTRKEVALFVDFENIREGIRTAYGVELNPTLLIEKARKYGLVNIARAYADFDRVPAELQREMQVCGLAAINAGSHLVGDRRRSAADLDLLMDLIETMLDRSGIPTILLMSGDQDFLRVVTMARHRFGKEVIISGIPGTVAADLIDAAGGNYDPLEVPGVERQEVRESASSPEAVNETAARPAESAPAMPRRPAPERPRPERSRPPSYGRRPARGGSARGAANEPRAQLPQPDVAEELGPDDSQTEAGVPTWQRGKLAERAEAIQRMMDERRAAGEPVPAGWSGQPTFEVGDSVEGVVKSITDFGAFLDVGGVDALLHVSQMAWQHVRHPSQIVQVGAKLTVRVLELDESNGRVSVGLKQLSPDPWLTAADKYELGSEVSGRVSGVKEYGVFVELEPGIFGLLHISNIFEQPWGHHPSERYKLDQEVEVTVSKIDAEMRRLAFVLPGTPIPPEGQEGHVVEEVHAAVGEDEEEAAEAAFRFREGEEDVE
jgi:predicted RNA-binding protein with RPS1 domain/uncharacterized LabA/DUF88 family protein